MADTFSWQSAFYLGGLPGIFFAAYLLKYAEIEDRRISSAPMVSRLVEIGKTKILWYVFGGYTLNAFALNGIAGWIAEYGQGTLGYTSNEIGQRFGLILVFAGFGGTFFGGRLASRIARGKVDPAMTMLFFVGMTGILGAPFVYFAFGHTNTTLFLAMCFIAEVLVFAGMAPVNAIIVSVCPAALVTLTQGVSILLINTLGALPAPVFVGYLSDVFSLTIGLQMLSFILLLSGIVWTCGSFHGRLKPNERGEGSD